MGSKKPLGFSFDFDIVELETNEFAVAAGMRGNELGDFVKKDLRKGTTTIRIAHPELTGNACPACLSIHMVKGLGIVGQLHANCVCEDVTIPGKKTVFAQIAKAPEFQKALLPSEHLRRVVKNMKSTDIKRRFGTEIAQMLDTGLIKPEDLAVHGKVRTAAELKAIVERRK